MNQTFDIDYDFSVVHNTLKDLKRVAADKADHLFGPGNYVYDRFHISRNQDPGTHHMTYRAEVTVSVKEVL